MRLWNRLLTGCVGVLLLGLVAGAAHATSTGGCRDRIDLEHEIGGLRFSNFCLHSPSRSVDSDDLRITFVDDDGGVGVNVSALITPKGHGSAKFYLSYDVTAVDALIGYASLTLASSADAPHAVFATKRVIGERPDKPDGQPWNDHGWGHLGWGLRHQLEGDDDPHGKTLAFLKTAEWDMEGGCLCDVGWGRLCKGEFLFDEEEGFDPQKSVKVIDGVWLKALRKRSDVTFEFSSTNRFRVVPEPAAGALLMLGLLGLAIGGRHF